MSKYQGSIVTKLADQEMPDEFIEKVLVAMPSTAGFAVAVENGENGIIKIDGASDGSVTIDQVKAMQEDYKDSTCIFYFSNFPKEFNETSCQPFPAIVNETEDVELAVFMDGGFDKKALPNSKFSPEYDVFNKYIKPALVRIWKGADKEIHATMEEISTDPGLPDLIGMLYEGQATVVLLASNGEMVTFGRNEKEASYEWGTASNPCGYGDKTIVEKAVETVKRGFGNRNLKGAAVTASPVPSAIPANVAASGTSEAEKYHAPPLNASKAEKSQWYMDNNEGIIPPGYKACPKVLKMEFRPIKTMKDTRLSKAKDAAVNRPIAEIVPARVVKADKTVTTEILPVISPSMLKTLAEFMKSASMSKITNEGRSILDPARIEEMEKKYSTFSEVAGLSGLEDTFSWPYEAWVKLGKEVGVEALALLGWNTSLYYQQSLAEEDEGEVKKEEAPEVKSEKKSGFGSRKLR